MNHSVLIVSGDDDCYPTIQQALDETTLTVCAVSDCSDALEYLATHALPNVIVLDDMLQYDDHNTFLDHLQTQNTNPQVLVLGDVSDAFEPDAILLKPLIPTDVLFIIEQMLIPASDIIFSPLDTPMIPANV